MLQSASVYFYNGRYFIQAMSMTVDGVWLGTGLVRTFPSDANSDLLGEGLADALRESRRGIPHPTDFDETLSPLLEAAGLTDWDRFERDASLCHFEAVDDTIRAIPMSRCESGPGYSDVSIKRCLEIQATAPLSQIGALLSYAMCLDK